MQFREAEKKLQEMKEEYADWKGKQHFHLSSISKNDIQDHCALGFDGSFHSSESSAALPTCTLFSKLTSAYCCLLFRLFASQVQVDF